MKIKLLLALVLNLATIGLSLPALAGNDDNWNRQDSDRYNRRVEHQDTKSSQYYGNYYPYKIGDYYIYVGSKGDYFDRYGKYYSADKHPEYRQYFNASYKLEQLGNYYDERGKYHDENGNYRAGNGNYRAGNGNYRAGNGKYRNEDGKYRNENGKYRNENGKYRNENGKYRNEDGKYRNEDGKYRENKRSYSSDR